MGKVYFASIRLAFALVCVGCSLIVGGHMLGLLPEVDPIVKQGRRQLSEALAVNASAHIRRQQWKDLETSMQLQVERNHDLLSIGLRSQLGHVRNATKDHAEFWNSAHEEETTVEALKVPINVNRRAWGNVELCFQSDKVVSSSLIQRLKNHPLARVIAFFLLFGIPAYAIFVSRMMKVFQKTQVVPDRVRQALDTLAEGLLLLDENENIVLANRAFAQTLGADTDWLLNRPASSLGWVLSDDEKEKGYPWIRAIKHAETEVGRILRYTMPDGDQRIFSVNAAPLGGVGSAKGALATFRDVTHMERHRAELESMLSMLRHSRDEIERKNEELQVLATQDALTGCFNRREFFNQFDQLWAEATAMSSPLACIMIDNDHFKNVNDTYGHHIGDEVLRQVSAVIRTMHEKNGLVCRYGGEEFCVVLPGLSASEAVKAAEKTRLAISNVKLDSPSELRLTASLGVSELAFGAQEPQDMINQADACLYSAKRTGRNCVVLYKEGMEMEAETPGPNTRATPRLDIPYQAVTALVSSLSYRDAKTAEHSRRVADMCVRVSKGLLSKRDAYVLEIAALLHDIGKVGVPDNILLKPTQLTKDECEIMARHERVGVEIVEGAFNCPQLTNIVANRHAFYDGNGRHAHLPTGEDIPMESRLLCIIDSYDSMRSDRVYRKGRSHAEAIAELRRCSGNQFDPKLVEHFISCIENRNEKSSSMNQAAIQIGFQVERIADALENRDGEGMQTLVERLGRFARSCELDSIAEAAENIEVKKSNEQIEWFTLLQDTHALLDVCRSAQSHMLRESLELDLNEANGPVEAMPAPVIAPPAAADNPQQAQ